MPDKSFEELLAELDIEEEKDQEQAPAPQEKPDNFKQLRDYTKRQERELKQLREFRETAVQKERLAALQVGGLTEAQANVYMKAYEEVTPEAIEAFKTNVLGIAPPAPAPEREAPETEASLPGFAPTSIGAPIQAKTYTHAEWWDLYKVDPYKARQVKEKGLVEDSNPEWPGGPRF